MFRSKPKRDTYRFFTNIVPSIPTKFFTASLFAKGVNSAFSCFEAYWKTYDNITTPLSKNLTGLPNFYHFQCISGHLINTVMPYLMSCNLTHVSINKDIGFCVDYLNLSRVITFFDNQASPVCHLTYYDAPDAHVGTPPSDCVVGTINATIQEDYTSPNLSAAGISLLIAGSFILFGGATTAAVVARRAYLRKKNADSLDEGGEMVPLSQTR